MALPSKGLVVFSGFSLVPGVKIWWGTCFSSLQLKREKLTLSFHSFFALDISFYFIIMRCFDVNITVWDRRDHSFINMCLYYMWEIITKYNCISRAQSKNDLYRLCLSFFLSPQGLKIPRVSPVQTYMLGWSKGEVYYIHWYTMRTEIIRIKRMFIFLATASIKKWMVIYWLGKLNTNI